MGYFAGSSGCVNVITEQLPADAQPCVERSPDVYGHDPGHPHVHGPGLRPAE